MIYAAVLAGGNGVRMGGNIPKQFIHIGDKPVIVYTIEKFLDVCDRIIVSVPEEYISYMAKIEKEYIKNPKISIIPSGKNRMDSLLSVMSHIITNYEVTKKDIIVTHDGVRPFVTKEIITETIEKSKAGGAAAAFINAVDTVAFSFDETKVDEVLVRDCVYMVQTPQTFNLFKLKDLFKKADNDIYKYTDLCGLAKAHGMDVAIAKGDRKNIKITTKEDLLVAKAIIESEEAKCE